VDEDGGQAGSSEPQDHMHVPPKIAISEDEVVIEFNFFVFGFELIAGELSTLHQRRPFISHCFISS
jgi:hypothetical protein